MPVICYIDAFLNCRKIPHYLAGQYLGGLVATAVGKCIAVLCAFGAHFCLAYSNHYSAITMFDGGVRSAFFTNTSTAGILTSHPSHSLTLSGAFLDQVIGNN